jgi:5'-phosphate synthase pdxT subunit
VNRPWLKESQSLLRINFFHVTQSHDMDAMGSKGAVTVGVLALQGAFNEHTQLLRQAAQILTTKDVDQKFWAFVEVRTVAELDSCDGLIIPGGESTAISLVAERSGMLEPLRDYVK